MSKIEKQKIEETVEGLLREQGYDSTTDTFIDISKLATSIGLRVGESDLLPFKEDGFIFISKDKKQKLIGVNNDRAIEEKRFIVAHELAHYYLHYKDSNSNDAIWHREHNKGRNNDENDADYFAACILMPEKSFVEHYKKLKNSNFNSADIIDRLQEIFRTPKTSVARRIAEIEELR